MNAERLTQLVRVLKEVQASTEASVSFDLFDWMQDSNPDLMLPMIEEATRNNQTMIHIPHACGTTACAVGYAGFDPWFRSQGWTTTVYGGIQYEYNEGYGPECASNWPAVTKFFELSLTDAEELFQSFSYKDEDGNNIKNPLDLVIERVTKFIQCEVPTFQG